MYFSSKTKFILNSLRIENNIGKNNHFALSFLNIKKIKLFYKPKYGFFQKESGFIFNQKDFYILFKNISNIIK